MQPVEQLTAYLLSTHAENVFANAFIMTVHCQTVVFPETHNKSKMQLSGVALQMAMSLNLSIDLAQS